MTSPAPQDSAPSPKAAPVRLREDLIHPDPLLDCLVELCRRHGQAATRVAQGSRNSCCGAGDGCGTNDPITSNLYDAGQAGEVPEKAMLASQHPRVLHGVKVRWGYACGQPAQQRQRVVSATPVAAVVHA